MDEADTLRTLLNPETGSKNYFDFEADFVEDNVRCIPMIVRFKLDAVGIKLKLHEWSRLTAEERTFLAIIPADDQLAVKAYRVLLTGLIKKRAGHEATELPVDDAPAWNMTDTVPAVLREKANEVGSSISTSQWQQLSDLQRFALMKLCRPGHENRNFPKAMREFGLIETT